MNENLPTEAFWENLHGLQFVDQPGCWTTCGGGYCCKTNSPYLKLNLMKPNSAGMVFFQEEYEFLERKGKMQAGFKEQTRFWRFPFSEGRELKFATSVCSLDGKCSIPEYRPLLCKLYPFLPRLDLKTLEVIGYVNASVIDQLWAVLKIDEPCTLAREKADIVKQQLQKGIKALNKSPYLLLYLKAAELFLDQIAGHFKTLKEKHSDLTTGQLTGLWEMTYLSGKAADMVALRTALSREDGILRERFGDFGL